MSETLHRVEAASQPGYVHHFKIKKKWEDHIIAGRKTVEGRLWSKKIFNLEVKVFSLHTIEVSCRTYPRLNVESKARTNSVYKNNTAMKKWFRYAFLA